MKKILVLAVGAYVLAIARTATAVPVVPNFTQGAMTSTTETTSTVTETINSMNYDTGYQYVITGTNVQMHTTYVSYTEPKKDKIKLKRFFVFLLFSPAKINQIYSFLISLKRVHIEHFALIDFRRLFNI